MSRIARVVVPGLPHHVTQRGNRRAPIFFQHGDQALYKRLLAEQARFVGVECWAYCLMPNHVHLILTPREADGLSRAVGEAHRRYTAIVNERQGWVGHLFQNRFASVVMDEAHLMAAVRYVALNPVRAGLVRRADDWPWSSARAHLLGRDDDLVRVQPVLERAARFEEMLEPGGAEHPEFAALRKAETTGRPLGSDAFIAELERGLGRTLAKGRPGPAPKARAESDQGELWR